MLSRPWRLLTGSTGISEFLSTLAALPRRAPECTPGETTLMGFLHLPDPDHSGGAVPGLWSSPSGGSHIAVDSPTVFGHRLHPAEAVPDRPWVPSIAPWERTHRERSTLGSEALGTYGCTPS
jgi:hypothetical protein